MLLLLAINCLVVYCWYSPIKIVRLLDFILRNEACLFLQIPNSYLILSFTFMDKQSVIIKVAMSRRKVMSRIILFSIVTRVTDETWFVFWKEQKIFLFTKMFRKALESEQPLFSWVTGEWSSEEKRSGSECDSPHLVQKLRMSGVITPLPYLPSWLSQGKFL